jgi:hypothetical protein
MKRLTTDNPDGNFETLMNYCYGKDHIAMLRYAGGCEHIPLHEYVAKLCKEKGCINDDDVTLEDVEERVLDPMGDCCDCSIGALYCLGCQAVNMRGLLKQYEDTGLKPDEIEKERHDMTVPEGYTEIDIKICADSIKNKGINIDYVDGVFLGKGEIVITGVPQENDEAHNCDAMGCTSVSHVLYRSEI